tara:strand:- start:14971 stop:15369 length:399 start_codon:yes stop_codon:yes gene_type:complete
MHTLVEANRHDIEGFILVNDWKSHSFQQGPDDSDYEWGDEILVFEDEEMAKDYAILSSVVSQRRMEEDDWYIIASKDLHSLGVKMSTPSDLVTRAVREAYENGTGRRWIRKISDSRVAKSWTVWADMEDYTS